MSNYRVISFEGLHGCGKTTSIQTASEFLREMNVPSRTIGMNSDVEWSEVNQRLRRAAALSSIRSFTLAQITDLQLQLDQLSSDSFSGIVLADRYVDSIAVRAAARAGASSTVWVRDLCATLPQPTATAYLRITPELSLERRKPISDASWRSGYGLRSFSSSLDSEAYLRYTGKLRACFEELAPTRRITVIDASRELDRDAFNQWLKGSIS